MKFDGWWIMMYGDRDISAPSSLPHDASRKDPDFTPMPFIRGKAPFEAIPGSQRCTAMSKQARRQCRQLAAPGSDKCRFHGGWSPRGRQHPGYRHGGASKATRATLVWLTSIGVALKRLEQAESPDELTAAKRFVMILMLDQPVGE